GPAALPGSSLELQQGDWVAAVGRGARGESWAATGAISRSVVNGERILTTVPSRPGSAGAALLDGSGRWVAVVGGDSRSAAAAGDSARAGADFAWPREQVVSFASEIVRAGKTGRGYLGIRVSSARAQPGDTIPGVRIIEVMAG